MTSANFFAIPELENKKPLRCAMIRDENIFLPNRRILCIGSHPDLISTGSINGYLYRSEDGSVTWVRCAHEFGELRSLAILAERQSLE
ncbi:hypothetical protein LBMAG21_03780 [Armatimonadota bacterium]|nr:hypothetical protein LBMAG21_03780 [Armatimonadota bacterium]